MPDDIKSPLSKQRLWMDVGNHNPAGGQHPRYQSLPRIIQSGFDIKGSRCDSTSLSVGGGRGVAWCSHGQTFPRQIAGQTEPEIRGMLVWPSIWREDFCSFETDPRTWCGFRKAWRFVLAWITFWLRLEAHIYDPVVIPDDPWTDRKSVV